MTSSRSLFESFYMPEQTQAHYGFDQDGVLYGDTQLIYTVSDIDKSEGGHGVDHLGFGDFGTSVAVTVPGMGKAKIEFIRADGSEAGDMFKKKGFVGRPHILKFKGMSDYKKAGQSFAKVLKDKGAKEV